MPEGDFIYEESAKSRRDFLKTIVCGSGIVALSSFLQACGLFRSKTLLPDLEKIMLPENLKGGTTQEKAMVSLVKTEDRATGAERALRLLGINPARGRAVFLKPNFNSADPAPGSTHNDTLRALISMLWSMGATSITLGDRSGMGNTREVMENKGIFRLARELDFKVLVLDEVKADGWKMFQPPGSHWQEGFPFSKDCLDSPSIVQAFNLKTHRFGGHFTLSLKNSVGLVARFYPGKSHDYMKELHNSPYQRAMIAEINDAYSPSLILMDGVEAFTEGGPDKGKKVNAKVMLAATDRIAMDAVGVALLRHLGTTPEVSEGPVFQQEQIKRAVELDLGIDSPDKIEIITEDPDSEALAKELKSILEED